MITLPITTPRLIIRRFEPDDLPAFLEFMLDEKSTRYLTFEPEQTTEIGATRLFELVVAEYDSDHVVHAYAIADRVSGLYLGSCGFAPYDEEVLECYYAINPAHRGQGLATEALTALLSAFPRGREIRAYCHPANKPAQTVAIRAGMTRHGTATHRHSGLVQELFSHFST